MKTVIEMAREVYGENTFWTAPQLERLERFAELVRADAIADEREACAKVCDDFERAKWESVKNIIQNGGRLAVADPMHCAAAIRSRSGEH